MQKIYSFDELNIQKKFQDSIEINNERFKLIKVIDFKDLEICEKVLNKKGISKYYFIKTNAENIGIFVSYFQFNRVLSFLEDERVPNTKIKLSEFIKEYENYSLKYVSNIDDMKSTPITNVKKSNVILQNFEDITKSEVIGDVLKKGLFILIYINISIFLITFFLYKKIILQVPFYLNIIFIPIVLILCFIEIMDVDKKKFRIENFDDKIVINDYKEILHKDIKKVYVENYLYGWIGDKPKNSHFKIGLGLGYGPRGTRKVLVIEYDTGYSIKKVKFQLKYVNSESLNEFIDLFRNQNH